MWLEGRIVNENRETKERGEVENRHEVDEVTSEIRRMVGHGVFLGGRIAGQPSCFPWCTTEIR